MPAATQNSHPSVRSIALGFLIVILTVLLGETWCELSSCKSGIAQETTQLGTEPAAPASAAELRKSYDDAVDELRTAMKELWETEALYLFSDSEESHEHKENWDNLAIQTESQFEAIREKAYALFWATENPDEDLKLVVRNFAMGSSAAGKLGLSYRIIQRLTELDPDIDGLAEELIRIEIFNNKFDDALEFKKPNADKIEKYNKREQALFHNIAELKTNFDRELKLREKDKTANLPRVEMKIKGKGTVVLELFEDEVPETVANFISLVEDGFYDGTIFHHAVSGYLIHGGFMSMNRLQPTGYTIYDESKKPERRHHFRSTLAMWTSSDAPNSCGAEFSIFRMPVPNLADSNHTVFGRVIEGMELVDDIQNTRTLNEEEGTETMILDIVPDTIESMKVIRKRDHDYEPNPVK